jgi:hypothetical protein
MAAPFCGQARQKSRIEASIIIARNYVHHQGDLRATRSLLLQWDCSMFPFLALRASAARPPYAWLQNEGTRTGLEFTFSTSCAFVAHCPMYVRRTEAAELACASRENICAAATLSSMARPSIWQMQNEARTRVSTPGKMETSHRCVAPLARLADSGAERDHGQYLHHF